MVVDDEILSRRAITTRLEKAISICSVEEPQVALTPPQKHLRPHLPDVQMPGMDGSSFAPKSFDADQQDYASHLCHESDRLQERAAPASAGHRSYCQAFMFIELSVKR